MKYSILFFLLSAEFCGLAIVSGSIGLVWWWPGASLLVAAAYSGKWSWVFGKRPNGKMSVYAVILLMPYLLAYWGIWHIQRFLEKDCYNKVAPGIWLGRRAYPGELPDDIDLIVDLTAEFSETQDAIAGKSYLALPILDASVPKEKEFRALLDALVGWQGNIYLHCAVGRGRSAMVAAALLVARELADNPRVAEDMLRKARPGVKLNKAQRDFLTRMGI